MEKQHDQFKLIFIESALMVYSENICSVNQVLKLTIRGNQCYNKKFKAITNNFTCKLRVSFYYNIVHCIVNTKLFTHFFVILLSYFVEDEYFKSLVLRFKIALLIIVLQTRLSNNQEKIYLPSLTSEIFRRKSYLLLWNRFPFNILKIYYRIMSAGEFPIMVKPPKLYLSSKNCDCWNYRAI